MYGVHLKRSAEVLPSPDVPNRESCTLGVHLKSCTLGVNVLVSFTVVTCIAIFYFEYCYDVYYVYVFS